MILTGDLVELKARVDGAKAGSRELDAAIYNALVDDGGRIAFRVNDWSKEPGSRLGRYHDGWLAGKSTDDRYSEDLPRFTASLDAALALVERLLPGWDWRVGTTSSETWAVVEDPADCDIFTYDAAAPTPSLAMLSALLSALIAREEAETAPSVYGEMR